jgi:hypothetical protein
MWGICALPYILTLYTVPEKGERRPALAEDQAPRLRGGRASKRDPWFGLSGRPGFRDFRDWWHIEKNFSGRDGRDLMGREEAEGAWDEWEASGRPSMRLLIAP